jgi:hypothetical protein
MIETARQEFLEHISVIPDYLDTTKDKLVYDCYYNLNRVYLKLIIDKCLSKEEVIKVYDEWCIYSTKLDNLLRDRDKYYRMCILTYVNLENVLHRMVDLELYEAAYNLKLFDDLII